MNSNRIHTVKYNPLKAMLVVLLVCCLAVVTKPVQAGPTELDGSTIPSSVYNSFQSNYRKYALFVREFEDGHVVIPNYNRRWDSSRGISVAQALDEFKVQVEEKRGNMTRTRTRTPDRADAEAYVRALPELRVGRYGWVASAEVVEVLGRKEMIVKDIWLVDRDSLREDYEKARERSARENDGKENKAELNFNYEQRLKLLELQEDRKAGFEEAFRLVGFDTRGLRVGDRWKGLNDAGFQVGVVKWEVPEPEEEEDTRRRRRKKEEPRLVLTELDRLMRGKVGEQDFKELLQAREMTVADFVDLIRSVRDEDRQNAEERIFNSLLPPNLKEDD